MRGLKQGAVGYSKKTALLEEAITQMNAGKYGRASAALKDLLALDPHNMEARRLFATLHLRLGSLIPARQAFDSLIDEAFERQDFWLAESLLREYLAAGPRCVPYLEKLGSVYQDKGEVLEAVVQFGKAIDFLIEDPDPAHPHRAAQLYAKIRDLAPASPDAIRLAGCFDAQTGELIAGPSVAVEPHSSSTEGIAAEPTASEPIADAMSWEQIGNSPPVQESAAAGYPQETPVETGAAVQAIEEMPGDAMPLSPGAADRAADPIGSHPIDGAMSWEQTGNSPPVQESAAAGYPQETPAETGAAVQVIEEMSGDTLSSCDSPMNGQGAIDLESESASTGSVDSAPFATKEFRVLDGWSQDIQPETSVQAASASMPWEDVQETTIGIPEQTGVESSDEISFVPEPDQAPADLVHEASNGGAFSWDSTLPNVLKIGSAPPIGRSTPDMGQKGIVRTEDLPLPVVLPTHAQEIDPGTIEIPEAARASLSSGMTEGLQAVAPMPWDQVEEIAIAVPSQEQTEETAVELAIEPMQAFRQEPGYEQDRPLSIGSPTVDAPEMDAFSFVRSSPAPEQDSDSAGSPSVFSATDGQTGGSAVEQQPSTFSFAGETLKAAELEPEAEAFAPPPVPLDLPPAVETVPLETQYESLSFSLKEDSAESALAPRTDLLQVLAEPKPDPPLIADDLSNWKTVEAAAETERLSPNKREEAAESEVFKSWAPPEKTDHRRVEPEELQQPAFVETKASPEPAPPPKDRIKTEESIRFVEAPLVSSSAEAVSQASPWGEQSAIHPTSAAAAAVDVLFESSGTLTQTGTIGHTAQPKPRPKRSSRPSRLRIAISSFIGSCFSTTRSIVVSLIALVVLSSVLAVLGIGAVGVAWRIMEEPRSSTFASWTTSPQRMVSDVNKNGYLLLLGFDAASGQDPVQAGYERKPDGKDTERALACLKGSGGSANAERSSAAAEVLSGWFRGSDPIGRFKSNRTAINGWASQGSTTLGRYRQWQKLSFEDWGYGQTVSPPCAAIQYAHRLYLAEGFAQGTDIGIDRLETDIEAWRIALRQAKTLPVKTLALQAINDDIAVASGLLAPPNLDAKYVGRLATMIRPLDQTELSIRWPMQSELVYASKAFESQLKAEREEGQAVHAAVASFLPLPKQRRLNDYAEYYEASYKAAGEGRHGALPKWSDYIRFPASTVKDYFSNPIENIVGLDPLASWDHYNGLVVDTDAHLRLASLQAWIRRGSQDADLLPRIAKAGQKFYDPYTGFPMLVNLKKGVLYSVGHDVKDQDADPESDVVVAIPVR